MSSSIGANSQAPVSPDQKSYNSKDARIKELEALLETISRGKYMWESTFDAITSPVMIVSHDYHILRANRAAAHISKVDVRALIGTKCHETLAGSPEICQGCPLSVTLKKQTPGGCTLEPFQKSERQFAVHSYPLKSSEGEKQVVLYYQDVTEEKDLNRRLLQSEKLAAIGQLAGGVAHEINNPLGGILAFAQLAMRQLEKEHPAKDVLKEIEEAALRCKRIVQDLLDFSRQSGDENMVPMQMNDVVNKIVPLVQVQTRASRIRFESQLATTLPSIKGSVYKLQQVFLNLINNACQAVTTGGFIKLSTFYDKEKNIVCAEIEDNGHGIRDEHLSKIFDPYFTTKKQGEGTGLGLAITYGIVEEHGGSIEVKSVWGHGAKFKISFPAIER